MQKEGRSNALNKSESKYFNTAVRMDKAFLELLGTKSFEYITVKEICEKAGVNRSTFTCIMKPYMIYFRKVWNI